MSSMDNLHKIDNKVCRVVIHRARNLKPRGKDTKSSPFVTISLGKEKFATSVIEKSQSPEWNEDCQLNVRPSDSKVEITVLHQDFFLERFLGRVEIPLMEIEAAPKRSIKGWYKLLGKGNKTKKEDKHRGEIEITAQMKGEGAKTILHAPPGLKNFSMLDVHPLRKSSSTPFIASTNPFDDEDYSTNDTDPERASTPVDIPAKQPRGFSEPHKSPQSRIEPSSPLHTVPSPSFQRHGMGRKIVRTSIRKEKEPLHASTPDLLNADADDDDDDPPLTRQDSYSSHISNNSTTFFPSFSARFRKKASTISLQEKPQSVENAMKKVEQNGGTSPRPIHRAMSEECLSKSSDVQEAEKEEVQHPAKKISYKPAAKSARRAKATSQYYAPDSPSSPPPHGSTSLPSSPTANGTAPSKPAAEDTPDGGQFVAHPYQSLSKEELIKKLTDLETAVKERDKQIIQQERYIDELLLKVITVSPGLLDQGYQPKPSIKARTPVHRYQAKKQEVII